jgi:lysophospholipase L1-like esterase
MKLKQSMLYSILTVSILANAKWMYNHFKYGNGPEVNIKKTNDQDYFEKVGRLEGFSISDTDIIFIGNSLIAMNDWGKAFNNESIKNFGIGGETTFGILKRIAKVVYPNPNKIFIDIGVNDIAGRTHGYPLPKVYSLDSLIFNYEQIVTFIKVNSPRTNVFIQSILPISNTGTLACSGCNEKIVTANIKLKELAVKEKCTYVDLHKHFLSNGQINNLYTTDGIHLNKKGYELWESIIKDFVK